MSGSRSQQTLGKSEMVQKLERLLARSPAVHELDAARADSCLYTCCAHKRASPLTMALRDGASTPLSRHRIATDQGLN